MTKIKLVDGTIINASNVEVVRGTLKITTTENTVEKLAEIFNDKGNISLITLLTERGKECGYKTGFTSFAGITYDAEGNKTVELFQPKDVTEARIANAMATANIAQESVLNATEKLTELEAATNMANEKVASSETDITDIQLALVELYELVAGGIE